MIGRALLVALLSLGPASCGDDGHPGDVDAGPIDAASGTDGPTTDAAPADAGSDASPGMSPLYGKVIVNEVLIDGLAEGDPNGDGDVDAVDDQFVELVNVDSAPVALDGCTLVETDLADVPRHTFATATTVPAGHAVVVFGGGDAPPAITGAVFLTANADDPGIPWGLHLSSPADTLTLVDADGLVVARFCYGGDDDCSQPAQSDESLTRSPELTGSFVPHTEATGSGGAAFSPGTHADGSSFSAP